MGPEYDTSNTPLSRLRFSWDIRSVPWMDGNGDQFGYFKAVGSWGMFHYNIPYNNKKKIIKNNRGITLLTHAFLRALSLCPEIVEDVT